MGGSAKFLSPTSTSLLPLSQSFPPNLSTPSQPDQTIGELGEQALLAQLQKFSPAEITGDDAAVFDLPNSDSLVISTDMLVENVHFSDQTTSAFDVGWRGAAANLSDLAAMGATPTGITVALALPPSTPLAWILDVYKGLTACLEPWRTPILGGDVSRSPLKTISITVLGQVPQGKALYRHQAKVGDWIIATGDHGTSRAGLECLLHPHKTEHLPPEQKLIWQRAHQRPQPRLDLVPSLLSLETSIGAMDSSDGLADAVLQICRASQMGAELWAEKLPIPQGLTDWVGLETAREWTLYGGEDFELILAIPPLEAQKWLMAIASLDLSPNRSPRVIGQITNGTEVLLVLEEERVEKLSLQRGFQHF
ncbi:slr1787 [Synechocystis sp. PCC 6803]|uniref:Thiamine-monophosphate kinase n=1 Tax=Synechocystis sp. (strain ATCC 27184 / PCC 6803 / Kazusa) TaxID=1111708 RepID=P72787_SYNY3|nr:thiamine-phosphate kinase [Synechocystis sp. PCC 6803]AVP88416.1 thiamine-phosphate kinase [Synechocystis sp. IPPAS B-1465]MBD2617089.1 thiamine-phosphate kinase [Synechocystis sp. FACHB-898]MBD2638674.1 thiamine-phosphate kinase [Synechocystis sp. FACHB-908]MBD2659703.1 thiamine-phosphate kinase [Synechocystis sp. FACHB-929]BAL27973.1 thiamine monophosphate kinase [Synechocystis sp. PCC 6803 substr. GT-I]BAL31143.1 thiamine monophosphate kinase [Synechocystis sp. PCC 6803 substr. PCC-N]B